MTNEERTIIQDFITRVSGGTQAPVQPGSVPATVAPLPPVDREADQLIGQMFTQYPDAKYRLTQTAFVQEHALAAAQSQIQRLQWELNQAKQMVAQAQQAQQAGPQGGGGFFGGLFGGGRQQPPPQQQQPPVWNQGAPQYQQPPQMQGQGQPQYGGPPPQYQQPGMFQRQGSGFLGSALTTAAGVAGGMVAGNALMGLFSGGHGGGGMFGGGAGAAAAAPVASPWETPAALPEPPMPPDQGSVDQGTWDTAAPATSTDDWNRQDSAPDNSSWGNSGGNDWGSGGGGSADC